MSCLNFPLDPNVVNTISTPDLDDNSNFIEDNVKDILDLPKAIRIDLTHKGCECVGCAAWATGNKMAGPLIRWLENVYLSAS